MDNTIGMALGALEIAGSLCGVPYVGAAAIVLRDIVDSCNQVVVQKVNVGFCPLVSFKR
jgi:hypothetical protein